MKTWRRFVNVDGFKDNTKELQQRDDGMLFLVKKKGRTYRTDTYTLKYALQQVEAGAWKEL